MTAPIASSQAAVYELAYREGLRVLSEQGMVRDALRTGAGLLLSAAAIATSFLGGAALESTPSWPSWVAIGAFVLLGVGVVLVLWPSRDDGRFARPALLVQTYADSESLELALVHRDLALHMDSSCLADLEQLERLITIFRGCSMLLLIEIVSGLST